MNVRTARLTTNALAGVCGVLLLAAVAQFAGVGRGYRWADDADGDPSRQGIGTIDNKPVQLPPISAFADIDAHPLFNEDRQPTPYSASDEEAPPPPSPLNIALTGVILDENTHTRIAMLQDKSRNLAIALKVGMPLEGDQASWTLVDVKPRGVTFRSAANETTEVALETSVAQPVAPRAAAPRPPAGRPPNAPAKPANGAAQNARGNANAGGANANTDLAHRIEERRRQMREDAERLRNGGKDKPPSGTPPKAPPKQ